MVCCGKDSDSLGVACTGFGEKADRTETIINKVSADFISNPS